MLCRCFAALTITLMFAAPAVALDMPTRKAGLWEIKMVFEGRNLPAQTMRHCTDPATDKLMNGNFGGGTERDCSKQDVSRSGSTMTVDSVCKFGDATTTSHAVVSGDFNSAYTVQVTSSHTGGPSRPGTTPGAETRMTVAGKWLGPCAAGQKAGDVIMANGRTMNVLDLQKMQRPNAAPKR